ncbi:formyl-coenzyme A transferase [compost metagenome]
MDMVIDAETADGGTRPMIGLPLHFDGSNAPAASAAPHLGQHTREVLQAFGFARDEVEQLLQARSVQQFEPTETVDTAA